MTTASRGYFPGSRTPLPEKASPPKPAPVAETEWDARPTMKVVGGVPTEFFVIGALCKALNRPPVTVRLWIKEGRIPDATFRMPDKNNIRGRRLYTRAQIEAVIRLATAHGILNASRVDWTMHRTFADEIRNAWAALNQQTT